MKADGIHLGQTDLPPDRARTILGETRIIGYSTHTLEQALEANLAPVDYIAIGPLFQTRTKQDPDDVVGLLNVGEVRRHITKPLVAIGGITLKSARAVIEAGADSVAVISDLYASGDVAARTRRFFDELV